VRLSVEDLGPGLAPEHLERIFDRFTRVGNGRSHTEGAGLGLAIVRAIVDAHGGTVEVDSRPGAGSVFTLVLPKEPRFGVETRAEPMPAALAP
jgi:two-component system, OmpR family, sensor kinase